MFKEISKQIFIERLAEGQNRKTPSDDNRSHDITIINTSTSTGGKPFKRSLAYKIHNICTSLNFGQQPTTSAVSLLKLFYQNKMDTHKDIGLSLLTDCLNNYWLFKVFHQL